MVASTLGTGALSTSDHPWQPLNVLPSSGGAWTAERINKLIWLFVALGIVIRSVRYLLRFPLWEDESFLCVSLLDRGYVDLLKPLEYCQVAPLLFMWVQRALVQAFGFNEYSLRLFAFVSGLGSLFLFKHLASRFVQGTGLLLAVGIFAVGYPGVRWGAEAKPYAVDVLVSLALLTLVVEWRRRPEQTRWLWAMTAFAPLALGLSLPAVFIGGGVSLTLLWEFVARRVRSWRLWAAWSAYNAALVGSFLGYFWLTTASQHERHGAQMSEYWSNAFPPADPAKFLTWLWNMHAGSMFAHPVGGPWGGSAFTLLCCVVAVIMLSWRRRYGWLMLFAAPFALNFVAAALHRYPYGAETRTSLFLAPAICLLAGMGGARILAWLHERSRLGVPATYAWIACLAGIAVLIAGRDFTKQCKSPSDERARAFAQWFWHSMEAQGDVVCLKSDLDTPFSERTYVDLSWAAQYLCNQRIYSPRHKRGEPPRWDKIAADYPVRCVAYQDPRYDFDQAGLERWAAQMSQRYRLAGRDKLLFPRYDQTERNVTIVDTLHVFTFVPKEAGESAELAGKPQSPAR